LTITFCRQVTPQCVEGSRRVIRDQMKHLRPGFALLCDLTLLETMDAECATTIGALIELCSSREMGLAVWVVPDPEKDIGLNLISKFHCWQPVRMHTRPNLAEALKCIVLERASMAASA
jgi:porphobilinogen deaminase